MSLAGPRCGLANYHIPKVLTLGKPNSDRALSCSKRRMGCWLFVASRVVTVRHCPRSFTTKERSGH